MSLANYRTRSATEIVDATFNLLRSNGAAIITVSLLVLGPIAIVKALAPAEWQSIISIVRSLLLPLVEGAIAAIVAAAVEKDQNIDVGTALRSISDRTGSLIAVRIAA